jgi:hypothetical protein
MIADIANRQVPPGLSGEEEGWSGLFYEVRIVHWATNCLFRTDSISCVLLNPEFSGSPVLKEFIFS